MAKEFERIDIAVEGIFRRDGGVVPEAVIYSGKKFEITRILSRNMRYAAGVPCVAPIEFRVVINGSEKSIYYEKDSGKWFAVRERRQA